MSINNDFTKNIISLQEAYAKGTLYKKKWEDGHLITMSLKERIRATFNHFLNRLSFKTNDENYDRLIILINTCVPSNEYADLITITRQAFETIEKIHANKDASEIKLINDELVGLEKKIKEHLKSKFINETFTLNKVENFTKSQKEAVKALIEDKEWTEITSLKPLKYLARKLENPQSELNEDELKLMAKCHRLLPKINKVEEAINENHKLKQYFEKYFNLSEFKAIQQIQEILDGHIHTVRQLFNDQCGWVEEKDGHLLPTKEQFSIALKHAKNKIPILMDNLSTSEIRKQAVRAVHLIMCDDDQIRKIINNELTIPLEDLSFRIKEISENENKFFQTIKNPSSNSYLEFNIGYHERLMFEHFDKIAKKFNVSGFFFEMDENTKRDYSREFNNNPRETLVNLVDQAKKNGNIVDINNEKEMLKENIKKIKEDDITNIKQSFRDSCLTDDLNEFLDNNFHRSPQVSSITIGSQTYNIKDKDNFGQFLIDFRELYVNQLIQGDGNLIKKAIDQNELNQKKTGINARITEKKLGELLKGNKPPEVPENVINMIVTNTSFTPKQIEKLERISGYSKNDIESLFRVKALQFMLAFTFTTSGLDKMENSTQLSLNEMERARHITIHNDLNGLTLRGSYVFEKESASFVKTVNVNPLVTIQDSKVNTPIASVSRENIMLGLNSLPVISGLSKMLDKMPKPIKKVDQAIQHAFPEEVKSGEALPIWENISTKEVIMLANKLKNREWPLTQQELRLRKQCSAIYDRINKFEDYIKENPAYQHYFNRNEFNAIKEVCHRYGEIIEIVNNTNSSVLSDLEKKVKNEQILLDESEAQLINNLLSINISRKSSNDQVNMIRDFQKRIDNQVIALHKEIIDSLKQDESQMKSLVDKIQSSNNNELNDNDIKLINQWWLIGIKMQKLKQLDKEKAFELLKRIDSNPIFMSFKDLGKIFNEKRDNAHNEFVQQYSKGVTFLNGNLQVSEDSAQWKDAVSLAKLHFPLLMNNLDNPMIKPIALRAAYFIMCNKEQREKIRTGELKMNLSFPEQDLKKSWQKR